MRKLALSPFALFYGAVVWLRNRCFDLRFFKSKPIQGKSICVGNIAVGGTGKSPHVAYLIELLSPQFPLQVLSRGYGRKTTGFILLDENSTPNQVGDESCMLFETYKNSAQFAVCEKRVIGVERLKQLNPNALILLDDAFQHRWVEAGLNLVLSTYSNPIDQDWLLPAGSLREHMSGLNRADALIVTKSPSFDSFDPKVYAKRYEKWSIPVFFSRYRYQPLTSLTKNVEKIDSVLIVSAIAKPEHLKDAFEPLVQIQHKSYPDHHNYTSADKEEIQQFFDTFATANSAIVTTAKDWVKIQALLSPEDQQKYPWFLLTFELEWLDQHAFNQFISAYVVSN